MKRPPGLWILLSAGFLWLSLEGVYSVRATSLIFGKSTTTTTTTTTSTPQSKVSEEEVATTEQSAEPNSTKPALTGNPQIDYIWDPNLPKELNGYNLSDYPFYERVPEDIDFKCDGLHDGFYASVKHKCQVYHHCLFGVRYDFLCANYTAFDQTLFNCNFVSNVDCENSKKFWNRNDELYKAASTTTAAPVIYNFRTPPSNIYALTPAPIGPIIAGQGVQPAQQPSAIQQSQLGAIQPQVLPLAPEFFLRGRRPRPASIPRPNYDYYDYEERPRPRSRVYAQYDYDDYDDHYDRRGRRRRPYRRGSSRREPERRRPSHYDYDEDDIDDYDDLPIAKARGDKKVPNSEDGYRSNRRRPNNNRRKKPSRPLYDDYEEYDTSDEGVSRKENRKPLYGGRRPPVEEDLQQTVNERLDKKRNKSRSRSTTVPPEDGRAIIKPVSGTLYDRPRLAPKINLPVPKNAAHKYAYKPMGVETKTLSSVNETEDKKIAVEERQTDEKILTKSNEEISEERPSNKNKHVPNNVESSRFNIRKRPISSSDNSKEENNSSTSGSQEETASPKSRTVMRKFKRPFLPSRGGSPYSMRNLKPVGDKIKESIESVEETKNLMNLPESDDYEEEEIQEKKPDRSKFVRVKSPLSIDISSELRKTAESRNNNKTAATKNSKNSGNFQALTERPENSRLETNERSTKISIEKLYENYDETINEASPTLTFPYQKYTTGLGSSNNYIYNNRFSRSPEVA